MIIKKVSASLDDMPAYEHFQDELDLELLRYAKIHKRSNTVIENEFIQFICFSLFLSKPAEITPEILQHFSNEHGACKDTITAYLQFMNDDKNSFLKNSFTGLLAAI
ncbi:hypothetical protein CHU_0988 [Cytophaga hutchinsonii ATCC 33406]|uniref:Uncharacterized protein n=1 Tax=Cytophaga hutchinsonii (strain ATCC 33406 / DSM 1761 / CIP 103989 / NBRC 15051 / NCIMB 9469 / D465) TaxID=269798 RepID=A0A6N4SPJ9_CYTH3|nr:hypothetical protein CHU_0988 [Cytophaga hutchinsonii ATCC 33406]